MRYLGGVICNHVFLSKSASIPCLQVSWQAVLSADDFQSYSIPVFAGVLYPRSKFIYSPTPKGTRAQNFVLESTYLVPKYIN